MMKYSVGYQLPDEDEPPFSDILREFSRCVEEVYFPWLDMPSGRSPMTSRDGYVDWKGQEKLQGDLEAAAGMGIKLNLLLNANCYGGRSLSLNFQRLACSLVNHLLEGPGLDSVTTSSLMLADAVKKHFPGLRVRASVNMRVGTAAAMESVADLFDEFCVQREYNRSPGRIEELKEWADDNGKTLTMLANSGCLNFCPGQVFHDNLVAHEREINGASNVEGFNPLVCWRYYRDGGNRARMLGGSWVRPEDIHNYDKYFRFVKLATRMHGNPAMVLGAYCSGKFRGNLADLLEPSHNPLLAPCIIDNSRFPDDWFERTSSCGNDCRECGYCSEVLERVLVKAGGSPWEDRDMAP